MNPKKAVVLFGAGAVIDWGGPRTICNREIYTKIPDPNGQTRDRPCCLTHVVTATGFKNRKGERITERIYQDLGGRKNNINFENIINVIEDLYKYYSIKQIGNADNLYSIIDFSTLLEDYSHFEVKEGESFYKIKIPSNNFSDDDFVQKTISPYAKFFEILLKDVLTTIHAHISKYSHVLKDKSRSIIQ